MATLCRLSHVAFNVPREMFDKECDFWENVIGLKRIHGMKGRNAFFTADPLRDRLKALKKPDRLSIEQAVEQAQPRKISL